MKIHRTAVTLTILNLLFLLFAASQVGSATSKGSAPALRASALELVDARGQVRARFNVQEDGEVILRLMDQKGTIRVKLGASKNGSGLLLANDATEPGVQILAKSAGSSMKLRNKDGRERMIAP